MPTWNAAFIYDTVAGAQGVAEILEFANSQLLEFRYYDELLDEELRRMTAGPGAKPNEAAFAARKE